ncbi:MAG: hypothetical protein GY822_23135 [Deltaproteobacteria bacterium]|nr:hypothetical protein [Deltaproteobacteria bacterium]
MRIKNALFALALPLSFCVTALPAAADEPAPKEKKEAPKGPSFKVDTSKTSKSIKLGEPGVLSFHIQPLNGTKVHPDAPLSIKLKTPEGISTESKKLGRKNVKEKKAKDPLIETAITGKSKGKQEVTADLTFFLCTDTACDRVKEQVKVVVEVTD